jgi:1-deoxy-D-xylulose-5-phosphate synthase
MRFVKPLDEALIMELVTGHDVVVTLEENAIAGGAGSAVTEFLNREGIARAVLQLGLPDRYVDHGKHGELLAEVGLDAAGIEASIRKRLVGREPDLKAAP